MFDNFAQHYRVPGGLVRGSLVARIAIDEVAQQEAHRGLGVQPFYPVLGFDQRALVLIDEHQFRNVVALLQQVLAKQAAIGAKVEDGVVVGSLGEDPIVPCPVQPEFRILLQDGFGQRIPAFGVGVGVVVGGCALDGLLPIGHGGLGGERIAGCVGGRLEDRPQVFDGVRGGLPCFPAGVH